MKKTILKYIISSLIILFGIMQTSAYSTLNWSLFTDGWDTRFTKQITPELGYYIKLDGGYRYRIYDNFWNIIQDNKNILQRSYWERFEKSVVLEDGTEIFIITSSVYWGSSWSYNTSWITFIVFRPDGTYFDIIISQNSGAHRIIDVSLIRLDWKTYFQLEGYMNLWGSTAIQNPLIELDIAWESYNVISNFDFTLDKGVKITDSYANYQWNATYVKLQNRTPFRTYIWADNSILYWASDNTLKIKQFTYISGTNDIAFSDTDFFTGFSYNIKNFKFYNFGWEDLKFSIMTSDDTTWGGDPQHYLYSYKYINSTGVITFEGYNWFHYFELDQPWFFLFRPLATVVLIVLSTWLQPVIKSLI